MDYQKEYNEAKTWYKKASVMSLYHTVQCVNNVHWTLRDTAIFFGVSMGLVSENIRLAAVMQTNPDLIKAPNRAEALKLAERRRNGTRIYHDEDE